MTMQYNSSRLNSCCSCTQLAIWIVQNILQFGWQYSEYGTCLFVFDWPLFGVNMKLIILILLTFGNSLNDSILIYQLNQIVVITIGNFPCQSCMCQVLCDQLLQRFVCICIALIYYLYLLCSSTWFNISLDSGKYRISIVYTHTAELLITCDLGQSLTK